MLGFPLQATWPRRAIKGRDARALEALASIVAPPFSLTVSAAVGAIALDRMRHPRWSMMVGALGLLAPAVATLRALWLVQAPVSIYLNLFALPLFVAWRTYITFRSLLPGAGEGWVRTERPGERVDGRYKSNELLPERSSGDQRCPFSLDVKLVFAATRMLLSR